jgi:hypothetical protein
LIGADYYKKYFPILGSYWRKQHIDKNSDVDMYDTIDFADYSTNVLISSIILSNVMELGLQTLAKYNILQHKQSRYYIPILLCYGYGIMINQYNKILADRQIEHIKKHHESPIIGGLYEELQMSPFHLVDHDIFTITPVLIHGTSTYKIYAKPGLWTNFPPFKTVDDATNFIHYIDQLVASNDVYDYEMYLYQHDGKSIYADYLAQINQPAQPIEVIAENDPLIHQHDDDMSLEI